MNEESTSNDVTAMIYCEIMSLKQTRIARLKALAALRQVEGPVELGKLVGRKANQISDILKGTASFGEKLARSMEETAKLPVGWLDTEDKLAYWPFPEDLALAVSALDAEDLATLEEAMRVHLKRRPQTTIQNGKAPGWINLANDPVNTDGRKKQS